MKNQIKVLLIEPSAGDQNGFIRLDRCMQSIDSWGGVYRFPLNLCRIAGHLISLNYEVRFIDLQADKNADLESTLKSFQPDVCILSCGYPSMYYDAQTARRIKRVSPRIHVSTFGVAPTALQESFFERFIWKFEIPFDSIIVGGEPALGYEKLLSNSIRLGYYEIISSEMENNKTIQTHKGRRLFNSELYRSPFTGDIQTYIEGSYGCPHSCNFCVVNQLYQGSFAKRSPEDIVAEMEFVIKNFNVKQISLWDEGTTFQRSQIHQICELIIKLKENSTDPNIKNFTWNTRSTTKLINREIVTLMARSGLSGITLGLESFDDNVLASTQKGTSVADNFRAINLLDEARIISIGHVPLGLPQETRKSLAITIKLVSKSKLKVIQYYCAVPYPSTELYHEAADLDLIRVWDLTKYELCNPIMDTISGIPYLEIGKIRKTAMNDFYSTRKLNLKMLKSEQFAKWSAR